MPAPPPPVDWGELTPRLRPGDRVCTTHGRTRVELAPIGIPVCSVCSVCRQMRNTVTFHRDGTLSGFAEPAPPHCSAAERHPLAGGTMTVSWLPCNCPGALDALGGHRAWRCSACTALGRTDDAVLQLHRCAPAPQAVDRLRGAAGVPDKRAICDIRAPSAGLIHIDAGTCSSKLSVFRFSSSPDVRSANEQR